MDLMLLMFLIIYSIFKVSIAIKLDIISSTDIINLVEGDNFEVICNVPFECNMNDIIFDMYNILTGIKYEIRPVMISRKRQFVQLSSSNFFYTSGKYSLTCRDQKNICSSDTKDVRILRKHPKPKIINIVVENWDVLKFGWVVEGNSNNFHSIIFMGWVANTFALDDPNSYTKCDVNLTETSNVASNISSCFFMNPFHKAMQDSVLVLKVNGTNNAGEELSSELLHIQLFNYIKPNRVLNIKVESFKESLVSFLPPNIKKSLKYNITVTCDKVNSFYKMEENEFTGPEPFFKITGLPAYTDCTVYISSIPSNMQGFWSPTASFNFISHESVPLSTPKICSSCYYFIDLQNGSYSAIIYFKSLSKKEARGVVLSYRMHIMDNISSHKFEIVGEPPDTQFNVGPLNSDHEYHVSIEAQTQHGFNKTLHLPVIIVQQFKNYNISTILNILSLTDGNATKVTWSASGDDYDRFVLFYCPKMMKFYNSVDKPICWNSLNWIYVDKGVNSYIIQHNSTLPTEYPFKYLTIGISSEKKHMSSGIAWNNCTHDAHEAPSLPDIHLGPINWNKAKLMIDLQPCQQGTGIVDRYIIQYCMFINGRCIGDIREINYSSNSNDLIVQNLESDSRYKLIVFGVSSAGVSSVGHTLHIHTLVQSKFLDGKYVVIIICLLVIMILAIALIALILNKFYRKSINKINKMYNVDIQLPYGYSEAQNFQIDSTNRDSIPAIGGIMIATSHSYNNMKYEEYPENILPLLVDGATFGHIKYSDTEQTFVDLDRTRP